MVLTKKSRPVLSLHSLLLNNLARICWRFSGTNRFDWPKSVKNHHKLVLNLRNDTTSFFIYFYLTSFLFPFQEYKFVDVEVNLCSQCLAACKGNRLSIECTRKPPTHGIASAFVKFVAADCQEELDRKMQRPLFKETQSFTRKPLSHRESKVFVWGLNDKDQLAGLKGSKVRITKVYHTKLLVSK